MVAIQDVIEDVKKTEIELFVINKVKEFRKAAKMSQRKLSMELRLGSSYVIELKIISLERNII